MSLSNHSNFQLQTSNLLIELPTWLGDAVMATPAIENLIKTANPKKITVVGSYVSTKILKNHPKIDKIFIDDTKKSKNRLFATYKLAKKIGKHDIAISFRSHFFSKLLLFFTKSTKKYVYNPSTFNLQPSTPLHQVEKYNYFINSIFKTDFQPGNLKLYLPSIKTNLLPSAFDLQPILGINPGATYGSAKRWYSEYFAKVAKQHSNCPSGGNGGDLGEFSPGQMVREFDEVVFNEAVNTVHGPIKTQFGYHLIEVTSRSD